MKILISLIKSKNLTYINFLYNKYSDLLVNLGYYIIKNNYSFLHIEKHDLMTTAYEVCSNLWRINDETIKKHGIKKLLRMQMVQKVIILCRKYNTQTHKILNNYVQILDDSINKYSTLEFNNNIHEFNLIIERNKDKINNLNTLSQLIFKEYYMNNCSRKDIAKRYNLSIQLVNRKIDYLKKLINSKFVK